MVPTGWLGTGVLPGTSVMVTREAVVCDGVIEASSEVPVTAEVVEEVLLVPGNVLPSSVVMAGPWWVLVPNVVPTKVEERRVDVGGVSMLISTPNELTARAVLVPTDVKVVVLSWLGVVAMEVGVGVLVVVSPSPAEVLLVVGSSPAEVLLMVVSPNPAEVLLVVGSSCAVVLLVVGLSCAGALLVVAGPSPGDTGVL